MDNASDYESGDWRFESFQARYFFFSHICYIIITFILQNWLVHKQTPWESCIAFFQGLKLDFLPSRKQKKKRNTPFFHTVEIIDIFSSNTASFFFLYICWHLHFKFIIAENYVIDIFEYRNMKKEKKNYINIYACVCVCSLKK